MFLRKPGEAVPEEVLSALNAIVDDCEANSVSPEETLEVVNHYLFEVELVQFGLQHKRVNC